MLIMNLSKYLPPLLNFAQYLLIELELQGLAGSCVYYVKT